ncbi:MAG TPA: F0F1 ATP synthase subunit B [Bacilli bacterium]
MSFEWTTFVYAIIAFGILYYFLQKKAFGPLFGIMEKRRERVLSDIKTAEQNRVQAEKLLEEQKQVLNQARQDAYEIIERAKTTSVREAEEIIRKAKDEAARLQAEALKDIESEKNKAVAALRSQVSAMSVLIASKIIEKQIDEKSQAEIVNHYLNEVGDKL